MLSIHGLVIAVSSQEEVEVINNQYGATLKFEVASQDVFNSTTRHQVEMLVPSSKIKEALSEIEPGRVYEISNAVFYEKYTKRTNIPEGIKYSNVIIKVEHKHFKILKPCIYYKDITNITIEGNGGDSQ